MINSEIFFHLNTACHNDSTVYVSPLKLRTKSQFTDC